MKLLGSRRLQKKLQRLGTTPAKRVVRNSMKAAMEPVMILAKQRAPVDKGLLRRGIRTAVINGRNYIGAKVQTGTRKQMKIPADSKHYYPAYFEYGSRTRNAQPFLRNSLHDKRKEVIARVGKEVAKALKAEANRK